MKLLTKAIEKKIPPLYTYDGTPADEVPIAVKFFTPDANWTWYVTEGEKQPGGDWLFFGLVDGFEKELGYFQLSELKTVRGPLGLPIERDRHFGDHTLAEVKSGIARNPEDEEFIFTVTDKFGDELIVRVIDSTHVTMAYEPEFLGKGMNTYHVGQLKQESYYDDIIDGISEWRETQ